MSTRRGPAPSTGTPRWVYGFAIAAAIFAVVFVVLHLTGHSPGHMPAAGHV